MTVPARKMHQDDLTATGAPRLAEQYAKHLLAALINGVLGANLAGVRGPATPQEAARVIRKMADEEGLFHYDNWHHAPLCPANHFHGGAAPSPFCTCGARARQVA